MSFKKIIFTKNQLKLLDNWAKKCSPIEAPAILIGDIDSDSEVGIVTDIFTMENIENSPVRFQIDMEEYYRIYQLANEKKKHIIGIFHSHPMNPVPSSVDIPFMKYNRIIWVILSTTKENDNLKAYQFENDKINNVEIEISD
ncbi:MAG: Mov34/MPN/PAD-1 family protein [Candidatus Helarchaeota archaeon]